MAKLSYLAFASGLTLLFTIATANAGDVHVRAFPSSSGTYFHITGDDHPCVLLARLMPWPKGSTSLSIGRAIAHCLDKAGAQ